MLELADELIEAGVGLFPISDDPWLLAKATSPHALSLVAALAGVPVLSPIVSVIPGQLLAMYLAERRRDETWISRADWPRSRGPNEIGSWLSLA